MDTLKWFVNEKRIGVMAKQSHYSFRNSTNAKLFSK